MARTLNGTSDTITVTRAAVLEPAFPLSLGTWVKGSSPGNFKYLISKLLTTGDHSSYAFNTNGSGQLRFYVAWSSGAGAFTASPVSSAPFDGTWHHVLGTYDGANVRLYVDGTEVGTGTAETGAVVYDVTKDLYLGSFDATQLYIPADVADVALWGAVLGADERTALAKGAAASTVRPGSLRAYWPLYGVAGPEPDLSGNRNNGALTGTALANHAPVGRYVRMPPDAPVAFSGGVSLSRTAGDALTVADSATRTVALPRAAADSVTAADSPTRTVALARTAADVLAIADGAHVPTGASRTAADTLTITDSAHATLPGVQPTRGTVTVVDVFRPVVVSADGAAVAVGTLARPSTWPVA